MLVHAVAIAVVCLLVVAWLSSSAPMKRETELRARVVLPRTELCERTSRIFVSVASYRDKLCTTTLQSMFARARYPMRVFAGVYEQNAEPAETCAVDEKYRANVRVASVHAREARGPCAARYRCSMLMRGEEVFLQIDSHTEFSQDWDVASIHMLQDLCGSQEGSVVISTYPIDCSGGWEHSDPPVIDRAKYNGSWITFEATVRGEARSVVAPSRQIGGGFLLCVASVVRHVPFDPGLDGVFNGEELVYTARLFTHGIDVVAPRQNVVCHNYFYSEHRTVWNDNPSWNADRRGNERADAMQSGQSAALFDAYGMGKVRTLDEFWAHVAINYPARTVSEPWA
jgi:hypothetical protein